MQQPANMRGMIPHAESLLNQIGYASASPVAGIQACFLRQGLVEFPHSVRIQPWGSAGAGLGAQPLAAF